VLVCVEQTGQSQMECHEDIQDANESGQTPAA